MIGLCFANVVMFVVQLTISFPILRFRSVGDSRREHDKHMKDEKGSIIRYFVTKDKITKLLDLAFVFTALADAFQLTNLIFQRSVTTYVVPYQ